MPPHINSLKRFANACIVTTSRSPLSKRQYSRQLRRERVKSFLKEPASEGNTTANLPDKSLSIRKREKMMSQKLDEILKPLMVLDQSVASPTTNEDVGSRERTRT